NQEGKYAAGMKMATNYLSRTGYRLPTEAEWEYACRAGSDTRFSFGEAGDLANKFAWSGTNSSDKSHPVGELMPNDLGLFDMHGNALEWCQGTYMPAVQSIDTEGSNGRIDIIDRDGRIMRGGSFTSRGVDVSSSARYQLVPDTRDIDVGF